MATGRIISTNNKVFDFIIVYDYGFASNIVDVVLNV